MLPKLPKLDDQNAARAIIWERARMAIEDPAGEADAITPMTQDHAADLLAEYAPELWPGRPRQSVQPESGPILQRLGIDPADFKGRVPCPAHGDGRKKTLSWAYTPEGRLLIHCFAGCTYDDIRRAVGL
jgi:hypothetical protein